MIKICGLKDRNKFTASHFKSLNVTFITDTTRLNEQIYKVPNLREVTLLEMHSTLQKTQLHLAT